MIGASGSGKSSLLRCINLLVDIDDGDILLDGEVVTDPTVDPQRVRRSLAMVFQHFNLFPHMRVLDQITLAPVKAHGIPKDEAIDEARALLARFGLADRERDYPDQLSGGQQQRVALIRAIATRPRALLLDEITSALDPELVGEVLEVVRELKVGGMTMLIATHEMAFARDVADEVCFLHQGRVVERGPGRQMIEDPQEPETQKFLARMLATRSV
jgi:polar amino acid transport system ATP-binding protein